MEKICKREHQKLVPYPFINLVHNPNYVTNYNENNPEPLYVRYVFKNKIF